MYTCWKRKTTSQMPKVNVKRNESEAIASKNSVIRLVMGCKKKRMQMGEKYAVKHVRGRKFSK